MSAEAIEIKAPNIYVSPHANGGTVETAMNPEDIMRLCPYMARMAIESPEDAALLLELSALGGQKLSEQQPDDNPPMTDTASPFKSDLFDRFKPIESPHIITQRHESAQTSTIIEDQQVFEQIIRSNFEPQNAIEPTATTTETLHEKSKTSVASIQESEVLPAPVVRVKETKISPEHTVAANTAKTERVILPNIEKSQLRETKTVTICDEPTVQAVTSIRATARPIRPELRVEAVPLRRMRAENPLPSDSKVTNPAPVLSESVHVEPMPNETTADLFETSHDSSPIPPTETYSEVNLGEEIVVNVLSEKTPVVSPSALILEAVYPETEIDTVELNNNAQETLRIIDTTVTEFIETLQLAETEVFDVAELEASMVELCTTLFDELGIPNSKINVRQFVKAYITDIKTSIVLDDNQLEILGTREHHFFKRTKMSSRTISATLQTLLGFTALRKYPLAR